LNFVSQILAQARHRPTALAICLPGARQPNMSYGRLAASLNNVAHHALAAGLRRGDTVAISVGDAVLHLILTLGLMRIGITTLSRGVSAMPPEIPVTANLVEPILASGATKSIRVDAQWMMGNHRPSRQAFDAQTGDGRVC